MLHESYVITTYNSYKRWWERWNLNLMPSILVVIFANFEVGITYMGSNANRDETMSQTLTKEYTNYQHFVTLNLFHQGVNKTKWKSTWVCKFILYRNKIYTWIIYWLENKSLDNKTKIDNQVEINVIIK